MHARAMEKFTRAVTVAGVGLLLPGGVPAMDPTPTAFELGDLDSKSRCSTTWRARKRTVDSLLLADSSPLSWYMATSRDGAVPERKPPLLPKLASLQKGIVTGGSRALQVGLTLAQGMSTYPTTPTLADTIE
jgi:hypothetical protein